MPPRRRNQKHGARESAEAPPSSPPSNSFELEVPEPPPPFFNTTFSTHRVSPLYIGSNALTSERLQILSQRLRDTLVGDVVRGVQVGLEGEDNALGRAGALERVVIRWVDIGRLLGSEEEHGVRPPSRDLSSEAALDIEHLRTEKSRGIWIEIGYENALCTGLLLPVLSDDNLRHSDDKIPSVNSLDVPGLLTTATHADETQFLHLPLLLLRMPAPLKTVILDFLSSSLDCRISSLRLGTKSLVRTWERWIEDAGLPSKGSMAKDMVLTLGFNIPASESKTTEGDDAEEGAEGLGIKSIDIIIPSEDLRRFARAGKTLDSRHPYSGTTAGKRKSPTQGWEDDIRKRRKLAGGKEDEGWQWRKNREEAAADSDGQPFMDALSRYLDHHLALDMFHPSVRITRIACGGFAISEGRVKVFAPPTRDGARESAPRSVWRLLEDLVAKAAG